MAINDLESRQEESQLTLKKCMVNTKANERKGYAEIYPTKSMIYFIKNQITYEEFEEQIRNFKENFQ